MDYENKYKQALSRATFYNNELLTENQRKMLLDIFPELTMSEDERMKDYIKDVIQAAIIPKKENKQKMIAWLEKQGEQKTDPCTDCTNDKGCVTCVDGNMKETIKSKFRVGDFITNGYCLGKVIVITNDAYLLDTGQGIPFSCENTHLWTIQDAKDGDVLYSIDSKQPFIYKERPQFSQARGYCCINKFDEFAIWDTNKCVICTDKYIPATKEQRELLFQKMKEAGYEWNADKKELKKIEVVSKEGDDERIRKAIHIYLDWLDERKDYQPKGVYTIRDMIDWVIKQDKKISADKVIGWLVANICDFDYYVKLFKKDFDL